MFSRFILQYYKQNARDSGANGFNGFAIGFAGVANGFAGVASGFAGVAIGFEGVVIGNVYCTFSNLCSVIGKVRIANAPIR